MAMHVAAPEYVSKLKDIFDKAEFSDVVFEASDGTRIPAHRSIVAIWSSLLGNRWKNTPNKKNSVVKIKELDGSTLRQFLSFMYGHEITVTLESIKSGLSILEAAHEYDVPDLVKVMDRKLHLIIDEQFDENDEETFFEVLKVVGRAGAKVTFRRLFEQLDEETGPNFLKKLFMSKDTRDHEVAFKVATMTWTYDFDTDSDDESDDDGGDEVDDEGGVRT